jgi:hypothetical protein
MVKSDINRYFILGTYLIKNEVLSSIKAIANIKRNTITVFAISFNLITIHHIVKAGITIFYVCKLNSA